MATTVRDQRRWSAQRVAAGSRVQPGL